MDDLLITDDPRHITYRQRSGPPLARIEIKDADGKTTVLGGTWNGDWWTSDPIPDGARIIAIFDLAPRVVTITATDPTSLLTPSPQPRPKHTPPPQPERWRKRGKHA